MAGQFVVVVEDPVAVPVGTVVFEIAGVTPTVPVGVGLIRIGILGATVGLVRDAVAVEIAIAEVAETIAVQIVLVGVGRALAVVEVVEDPVRVVVPAHRVARIRDERVGPVPSLVDVAGAVRVVVEIHAVVLRGGHFTNEIALADRERGRRPARAVGPHPRIARTR